MMVPIKKREDESASVKASKRKGKGIVPIVIGICFTLAASESVCERRKGTRKNKKKKKRRWTKTICTPSKKKQGKPALSFPTFFVSIKKIEKWPLLVPHSLTITHSFVSSRSL